jgi:transposase
MAKPLVTDELWVVVRPLLPKRPPRPKGGRPPLDDRKALTGILFVPKTGIPWEHLPSEMGCGSGMSCWRRLRDWQAAGVWDKIHRVWLDRLRGADKLDLSRAVVDSASVRTVFGGPRQVQTLRIAARKAASTISSPTQVESHWPADSPVPIVMT